MGDKLFLNFGAKFQRFFIIFLDVKLQNCLLTPLGAIVKLTAANYFISKTNSA